MTPFDVWSAVLAWCYAYRGSVTRSGSTAEHNADVGGVAGSPHRFFMAYDVIYIGPPPEIISATARAKAMGLLLIRESDHDHLQSLDWPPG